ncbi:DUF1289 domain-containing protein [Undibacterium sp. Ji22W]|uniref:DUF1289 domain-containing protein n=1 Tax=Undibacterium sp. Ji22W TaxID=3413038 RepID=UPI003BF2C3C0
MLNVTEEIEVISPCVKLCKIDNESGLCSGCLRTIAEITIWSKANRETKLQIWKKIDERKSYADVI